MRSGYRRTICSKREGIDCSISSFVNSTKVPLGWKHLARMARCSGGRSAISLWRSLITVPYNLWRAFLGKELLRFFIRQSFQFNHHAGQIFLPCSLSLSLGNHHSQLFNSRLLKQYPQGKRCLEGGAHAGYDLSG